MGVNAHETEASVDCTRETEQDGLSLAGMMQAHSSLLPRGCGSAGGEWLRK
jgi:hypothetical protein